MSRGQCILSIFCAKYFPEQETFQQYRHLMTLSYTMSDMALLHISCLQLESSHIHYLQTYGFLTIIYHFYDERCLTKFSLKIHGVRYNT